MHAQPPLPTQAPTQAPIAVAHLAMLPPPQLQQPPDSAPTVEFLAGLGKGAEPLLAGAFFSQPASSMSRKDRVALTLSTAYVVSSPGVRTASSPAATERPSAPEIVMSGGFVASTRQTAGSGDAIGSSSAFHRPSPGSARALETAARAHAASARRANIGSARRR